MATDIGSIRFTIEADSSQVNSATAAIEGLKNGTIQATKVQGGFSQSYARLRAQIDPAYRAQQQYNQSIKVLDAELARGTISLKQYSKNVQQLRAQTIGLNAAAQRNIRSFGAMRGASTQLGFQLQDIAIQAQAGTSAFIILGQQGSQIASLFGPAGALFGAVLAVGSALAGAFFAGAMDATDATETLEDRTKKLTEELGRATSAQARLVRGDFTSKILAQKQSVQESVNEIQRLNKAINDSVRAAKSIAAENGGDPSQYIDQGKIESARKEIERLWAQVDTGNASIDQIKQSLEEYNQAIDGTTEEQRKAREAVSDLISDLQSQADTLGFTARQIALYEAEQLNATAADKAAINAAYDKIEAYKRQQEQLKQLREATAIGVADDPLLQGQVAEKRSQAIIASLQKEAEATKRGLDERYAIEQDYVERVRSLRDGLRTGVIKDEEELNRLIVQATQERNDQLAALESNRYKILSDNQQSALDAIGSAFGNFAEVAKQGGEKSFQEYKNLASAQAAIAASLAAIKALAAAPPPFNIALAASIGALAAAQIASIQSQEYSSARVDGGQVQPGQSYLVGERGPEVFTAGQQGAINPNRSMQSEKSNGDVVINLYGVNGEPTTRRRSQNGTDFIDIYLQDMANNGPMSQATSRTFGLKRQGR